MAEELVTFHQQFHDCFGHRAATIGVGLSLRPDQQSARQIRGTDGSGILGQDNVRSLQRFMKIALDHETMKLKHQSLLSKLIADPQGMINVDSSVTKKGKESVGVWRRYCGAMGKVKNCQSGVFVATPAKRATGCLRAGFICPEVWFSPDYARDEEITSSRRSDLSDEN